MPGINDGIFKIMLFQMASKDCLQIYKYACAAYGTWETYHFINVDEELQQCSTPS